MEISLSLIANAILLGISLCADCFAVSLCSSLSLTSAQTRKSYRAVAPAFAVIQTAFFVLGYLAAREGTLLLADKVQHFERGAHILGFLLLLYVGVEMFLSGLKKDAESLDLNSFRNILLGGVATSLDALAVGMSMALDDKGLAEAGLIALSIFVFTVLSVTLGMFSGSAIGTSLGKKAQCIGGAILVFIGIMILI